MQTQRWVLWLLAVFGELGVCFEQPQKTTWTLFTAKKSWSEAQMVCEMMGGYLASMDTAHKMSVVQHFLQQSLWKYATIYSWPLYSAVTGLHNVEDLKADPYYWIRNCSQAAKPPYLSYLGTEGGCTSQTDSDFYSVACDSDQYFVCEVSGGQCVYETVVNKSPVSSVSYQTNVTSDVTGCRSMCDAGGVGCWAVAFCPATGECRVYNVTSPFFLDDGTKLIGDINFNLHIKRCYTALVNSASIPWVQYDPSPPASPCSASQTGRVYTLVKWTSSAEHAREHCHAMGHELAGATTVDDRNVVRAIISNIYQANFSVSQMYPVWVDFKLSVTGKAVWGNGSLITASVNVLGLNSTQCGLMDLERGTYYLDDCSRPHSFLCVTHRPCTYIRKQNAACNQNTFQSSTAVSEASCRSLCTQKRASGINCVGFTYRKVLFSLFNCFLQATSASGLYPNMTYEFSANCYWWTCVYVLLQVEDLTLSIDSQSTEMTTLELTTDATTTETGLDDQTTGVQLTTAPTLGPSEETTVKQKSGAPTTKITLMTTAQKTQDTTSKSSGTPKQTGTDSTSAQLTSAQTRETAITRLPGLQTTSGQMTARTSEISGTISPGQSSKVTSSAPLTSEPSPPPVTSEPSPPPVTSEPSPPPVTSEPSPPPVTSEPAKSLGPRCDASSDVCVTDLPGVTGVHVAATTSDTSAKAAVKPRMCSCRCSAAPPVDPVETEAVVRSLVVQRKTTFRSRLRYISVDDHRTSSKSLGAVAIMFMCLVAVIIILIDCSGGKK